MKKLVIFLMMALATASAFATTQSAKVCSVGRMGEIYTTEFRAEGSQAVMIVDGERLVYGVESAMSANLKRASAVAGEKIVEATEFVLTSPQGTTVLQIAVGASGARHMIFPENGILGASSVNCR